MAALNANKKGKGKRRGTHWRQTWIRLARSVLALGFALVATAAHAQSTWVGGTVFRDVNLTPANVGDDEVIPGVTINIFADTNVDGLPDGGVIQSDTTDASGNFSIMGLPFGEYVIVETDPANHISVYDVDSSNPGGDNAPNVGPTDNYIPLTLSNSKPDDTGNYFVDRRETGSPEDVCYAVADDNDRLYMIDYLTADLTLIGNTGVTNIETIAIIPGPGGNFVLHAANAGTFGTLNVNTGAFSSIGNFGGGFTDVDGMSFDALNGILWGTHRVPGSNNGDEDILFQINPLTGAGSGGIDVEIVNFGDDDLGDVDDIAVDPFTGTIYATINDGGSGGILGTIDRLTGDVTVIGAFGVDDIEGLAFTPDGELFGSTGTDGGGTSNSLYSINKNTGQATLIAPFAEGWDYEALACLLSVTGESMVSVTKTASPVPVMSGQPITYTITILNDPTSTGPATGVVLADLVPVDFTNVVFTSGNGFCTPTSGPANTLVTCNPIDDIPVGASTIIEIQGIAP